MLSQAQFSMEAQQLYQQYISQLTASLKTTDLSADEVNDVIEDVKDHIIDFCIIKSGNADITAEVVSQAIKKLGNPNVIAQTYLDEQQVTQNFLDNNRQVARQPKPAGLVIRAKHLPLSFRILSWVSSIFVFTIVTYMTVDGEWYYPPLYAVLVLFFVSVIRSEKYAHNTYLQKNFSVNLHLFLTPLVYMYYMVEDYGTDDVSLVFIIPLVMLIYLFLIPETYRQIIHNFRSIKKSLSSLQN